VDDLTGLPDHDAQIASAA
jgi:CRISPR/Cas system CSM-associated protein Csm3 (group 7 of RAMP superfamily)